MSSSNKEETVTAKLLLDFGADVTISREDARAELEADGVDVSSVVRRALAFVADKRREVRLAWKDEANRKTEQFRNNATKRRYDDLSRASLIAEFRARPIARVAFRNLNELTDEDIRSLLIDADLLGDGGKIDG